MWQTTRVIDLVQKLARTPARRGGILDIPFAQYAEDVGSARVATLLANYARLHRRPTLRAVICDDRFQRWATLARSSRMVAAVKEELSFVATVVEEEYILDDEEVEDEPPDAHQSLRAWAEEAGVARRLADPAAVLAARMGGAASWILRTAHGATVADVLEGKSIVAGGLGPAERKKLAAAAEAHVRRAGERALADRREEERIAALGHVPEGEGARAFLAAVEAALATTKRSREAYVAGVELRRDPTRLHVQVETCARGRQRTGAGALLLEDWRSAPLARRLTGEKMLAETLLRACRRVLRDPGHAVHAPLVAYLNEPPWQRVARRIAELATRDALGEGAELRIGWRVTGERHLRVEPEVSAGTDPPHPVSVEALLRAHAGALAPRDEAVARALHEPRAYGYYYPQPGGESRARTYRALALLVGHPRVLGRGGIGLAVREGELEIAIEEGPGGFRYAFTVAGEGLSAPELRAAVDREGFIVHIDPSRRCVLLAHVGARRAAVLQALVSEDAVFPHAAAQDLLEQSVALRGLLPTHIPETLAGERVEADARPHVRVVREGATLSLEWLVRPIPSGPSFPPGAGQEQVLLHVDGRAVFAMRAREDEFQRAQALSARLPPPAASGRYEGIEAMLAVIASLRDAVEADEAVVLWPKTLPKVVGAMSAASLRLAVSAERDWFGVRGGASSGGVEITLANLLAARRAGEKLVAIGPDRLVAIADDLRARLDALEAIARPASVSSRSDSLEIARVAAPLLAELAREQIDAAPPFWSLLERIEAAKASTPKLPRGFRKTLRPYQVDGYRWMSRLAAWGAGGCLADEMGLGKTVQALAMLAARSDAGPALVVAPTSVGPNWIREAARFAPRLRAVLHRGADRASALRELGPGDLLVTSYDIAVRDRERLAEVRFATIVADEAQAIKNGATARAQALRSLQAEMRVALTGTPVENRLAELHSLMEFLNPGFFGSEKAFRARYVIPIERDKDRARSEALAALVRPFLLRRMKSEVLSELPARTEITRAVERSAPERRLYEAARRVALEAVTGGDERGRFRVLAEIMRLRRLACHPRLFDERSTVPSSKLEAFLALVGELRDGGHRALVFSQFTGHLALVEEALRERGVPYLYLDGQTPLADRTRRVAAFQAGEGDVFLISLKAGGTGLNLTAADTVIHLDPWWNPAVEDQASDRAHRIGQTRPVTVVRLIAQGTIEEAVLALHADKRELAESILAGAGATGKLSMVELGALIREGATPGGSRESS